MGELIFRYKLHASEKHEREKNQIWFKITTNTTITDKNITFAIITKTENITLTNIKIETVKIIKEKRVNITNNKAKKEIT